MVKDGAVEQDLHFTEALKTDDMTVEAAVAEGGDGGVVANPSCFDAMEEDNHGKDLWLDRDHENVFDVNDSSIFYDDDDFPPLPNSPCMSSSSSTSSAPPPSKIETIVAASSSNSSSSAAAASWAIMNSEQNKNFQRQQQQTEDGGEVKMETCTALYSTASMEDMRQPSDGLGGDAECIDVLENFEYMDLIDTNEIWDPSSVFQTENPQDFLENPQQIPQVTASSQMCREENDGGFSSFLQENSELAMIFFEWLKQNKDYISAEDMRSIKLKRSTIESASMRLGTTKEGKKQLLKLILEWVEQYQLQKKQRLREETTAAAAVVTNPNFNPNPNFVYNPVTLDPNTTFPASQWVPPQPEVTTIVAAPPPAAFTPAISGYSADLYSNTIPVAPMINNHQFVNGMPYTHSAEYQMMEHARQPWTMPQFPVPQPQFSPYPDNGNVITRQQAIYGNPYQVFDPTGERLMRLGSSATKEARKKRMARQRRLYLHHHRHSNNSNQHQNQLNDPNLVGDCGDDGDQAGSPGNWAYWSAAAAAAGGDGSSPTEDASQPNSGDRALTQTQNGQRQASSDRRQQQGSKTEKNLKFLLQKVLKQSDVGNLGRIVLPKKEAESHLPELESRDGINIEMEDIGTSRVWNMRYRFWPNNKSRMYLLENTGDFVRVNGLQEGDFIVIYSDTKCGKYMIRGVKVRQPGAKLEGKKPARRNMRSLSLGRNSSTLAPIKQTVR